MSENIETKNTLHKYAQQMISYTKGWIKQQGRKISGIIHSITHDLRRKLLMPWTHPAAHFSHAKTGW